MSLLWGDRRAITVDDWVRDVDPDWQTRSLTGERVNAAAVQGLDTVGAVIGLYCDVVGMLPAHTYRGDAQVPSPVVDEPSTSVPAEVWRQQLVVSRLIYGDAFLLVTGRDRVGYPVTTDVLDPTLVTVTEDSTLKPTRYKVGNRFVPNDDIIHLPGRYVAPGKRCSVPPLARFPETFGLSIAARNFAARWFGEGAHPTAVLMSDQAMNKDQAEETKRRFMQAIRRKREPVVLGQGFKLEKLQSNPSESELDKTTGATGVAVARILGLYQPEMIGLPVSGAGSLTYANREQRAIDFLTFSMDPTLVWFERLWGRLHQPGYFTRWQREALLRTDVLTRYKAHDTAVRGGWRTPNEVRDIEDESPLPEGDVTLWPPYATTIREES